MAAKGSFQLKFLGTTDPPGAYSDESKVFLDRRQVQSEGSGANQIDRVYAADLTVPQGSTVDLDLQTILDQANTALTLTDVKWIYIEAAADNEQDVTMIPHVTNGWSNFMGGTAPTKTYKPGQFSFDGATGDGDLAVAAGNKVLQFSTGAGVDQTITVKLVGSQ